MSDEAAEGSGRGGAMVEREAVVTAVVPESRDTVTVHMIASEEAPYLAGQFISIDPHQFEELEPWIHYLELQKGRREPRRCYTLSSAPHERALAFTVKVEPFEPERAPWPPLLGGFLRHTLRPGRTVSFAGFSGRFVLPEAAHAEGAAVLHVVGGAGIVPSFSMIKDSLHRGAGRHCVLHGIRTWDDALFREALDALSLQHPGRLDVRHHLSREASPERLGPTARRGRVGEEALGEALSELGDPWVMVCGPGIKPRERRAAKAEGRELRPRFMETCLEALKNLGVPPEHLSREGW